MAIVKNALQTAIHKEIIQNCQWDDTIIAVDSNTTDIDNDSL